MFSVVKLQPFLVFLWSSNYCYFNQSTYCHADCYDDNRTDLRFFNSQFLLVYRATTMTKYYVENAPKLQTFTDHCCCRFPCQRDNRADNSHYKQSKSFNWHMKKMASNSNLEPSQISVLNDFPGTILCLIVEGGSNWKFWKKKNSSSFN